MSLRIRRKWELERNRLAMMLPTRRKILEGF